MPQERQTAYKLWISNILNSPFTRTTGEFTPNFITFNNKHISRVNIIANVIEIFVNENSTHGALTIDDGSATIQAKTFQDNIKLLDNIEMGNLVLVIGKIKEYNGEIYILPEIIKNLGNPIWGKIRRLELMRELGEPPEPKPNIPTPPENIVAKPQEPIPESQIIQSNSLVMPEENPKAKMVISYIEQSEEGISVENLSSSLNIEQEEIDKIILELLKNSEIYQNKPGCYKIL